MTYLQLGLDGSQARIHVCPHCDYSTPSIVDLSMHMKADHWNRPTKPQPDAAPTTKPAT